MENDKITQEELELILDNLDNKAYAMIRSWLFKKANNFAPNIKAFHLHKACNDLIPVIENLDPNYFKR